MLANFRATVLGRLIGIECLSAPSTGGTISIAVMHSSPACFVTIFILDHFELALILGSAASAVSVSTGLGFVAACNKPKTVFEELLRPVCRVHEAHKGRKVSENSNAYHNKSARMLFQKEF